MQNVRRELDNPPVVSGTLTRQHYTSTSGALTFRFSYFRITISDLETSWFEVYGFNFEVPARRILVFRIQIGTTKRQAAM